MAAFNSMQRQLIAKQEATAGTYGAPTYATDFNVKTYEVGDVQRDFGHTGGANYADGTMIKGKSYSGKKSANVQFSVELQYSGTLATAPKFSKFHECCGYVTTETVNAKLTWDGKPYCKSMSIHATQYECGSSPTGIADVIAGAVGTFDMSAEGVGSPVMIQYTFTGKYGGVIDLAGGTFTLPSSYDTSSCEKFLGQYSTLTIGAVVYRVYAWTFSQQNDIQSEDKADDICNTVETGIDRFAIKNASPQLTLTAKRVAVATADPYTLTEDDTVIATAVLATNNYDITFTGVQMIDVQAGNTNDTATEEITLKIDQVEFKQVSR